jgi:RNA-directed DNA polymerase
MNDPLRELEHLSKLVSADQIIQMDGMRSRRRARQQVTGELGAAKSCPPSSEGAGRRRTSAMKQRAVLRPYLHQLEEHIKGSFPRTKELGQKGKRYQVLWTPQVIRYADDLVIIHRDRTVIEACQEIAEEWLGKMGLEISQTKTRIAHTLAQEDEKAGFDFLGFNVRQYKASKYNSEQGFKTLIKPSNAAIQRHYKELSTIIDQHKASSQEGLIGKLNPVIAGWCRYYSTVVSKKIFQKLDQKLYEKLKRWAKRRHPRKPIRWAMNKYWHIDKGEGWHFSTNTGFRLHLHSNMPITRHTKVRGDASPFNGDWSYWATRRGTYPGTSSRVTKLMKKQKGHCKYCGLYFTSESLVEVHHCDGDRKNNRFNNLAIVHRHCHDQIHGGRKDISKLNGAHDKSQIN